MKIAIVGAGNMGSSIVKGLLRSDLVKVNKIFVMDISPKALNYIQSLSDQINIELDGYKSVDQADIIILAIKPWLINEVILDIKFKMDYTKQILVSMAAGVTIESMEKSLLKAPDINQLPAVFRAIPNSAISVGKSMTLIAFHNATEKQKQSVFSIFEELGKIMCLDESFLSAGTALASCNIAFVFRYIRAAIQAGTEMGFYPDKVQSMVVETVLGAAELLKETQNNPEVEIDKVTTPGGITIKGLNELEANGFSNAVIKGLKACNIK